MDKFTKQKIKIHKEFLESMIDYHDINPMSCSSEEKIEANASWRVYQNLNEEFKKISSNLTPKKLKKYINLLEYEINNNNGSSMPFDSRERMEANASLGEYCFIKKNINELFPEMEFI